jgi:FkbM family methyltransferase
MIPRAPGTLEFREKMPISSFQARAITGLYALTRRSGLLETRPGERLFTASYFLYKRYLEDPFAALAKSHPAIFRGGDILDIGANIGYTASLFAAASDRDARVYAFEPEPFNFRLLETTIQTRGLKGKVTPVHSAVGERRGESKLWVNDHHHGDHRIATEKVQAKNPSDGYLTVPMTSIDEFLVGHGHAKSICLIKIDVQGYELAVCRGMAGTIADKPNAIVALEYMPEAMADLGHDPSALLDWFAERNFIIYSLGSKGDLTLGLGPGLDENGYVDLVFSRTELK